LSTPYSIYGSSSYSNLGGGLSFGAVEAQLESVTASNRSARRVRAFIVIQ
jgi:hypothetical protein